MVEMFYNFNYFHHFHDQHEMTPFKFDYCIGRLRDTEHQMIRYKSLGILTKLIGDISSFDSLFIVDDMASLVWDEYIPLALQNHSCEIFPIQPLEFDMYAEIYWSWESVISQMNEQRRKDRYLYALTHFVAMAQSVLLLPATDRLSWITQYKMKEYLQKQGIASPFFGRNI